MLVSICTIHIIEFVNTEDINVCFCIEIPPSSHWAHRRCVHPISPPIGLACDIYKYMTSFVHRPLFVKGVPLVTITSSIGMCVVSQCSCDELVIVSFVVCHILQRSGFPNKCSRQCISRLINLPILEIDKIMQQLIITTLISLFRSFGSNHTR